MISERALRSGLGPWSGLAGLDEPDSQKASFELHWLPEGAQQQPDSAPVIVNHDAGTTQTEVRISARFGR